MPEHLHTATEHLYKSRNTWQILTDPSRVLSSITAGHGEILKEDSMQVQLTLSISLYALRMISMSLTNMRASLNA